MILKIGHILLLMLALETSSFAQYTLSGTVISSVDGRSISKTEIYNQQTNNIVETDTLGRFAFYNLKKGNYDITIFSYDFGADTKTIDLQNDSVIIFKLLPLEQKLTAVEIIAKKEAYFNIRRLRNVEGTSIYAGKKSEVILLDNAVGALASNTARQIYSQVVGLNIYENNDAGLQLNIGGRGLDPNRTSNFNTRQNGYDISADVLGYPESYYTPPAEALSEIQIIRGAASLQYGTQFGGLINFKMKAPNQTKKLELNTRQTLGSYGLFTSFNSLSGTVKNLSYYAYFNYKKGDGYRPNSQFDSKNAYANIMYKFGDQTKLSLELTYLKYLAKQAGGLTDPLFNSDPRRSTRNRNWFEVDWKLVALKFNHKFTDKSQMDISFFGLDAERNSIGFRGNPINLNSNPIIEEDEQDNDGNYILPRDLLKGRFNNWGIEAKFLSRYQIGKKDAVYLLGAKIYKSDNTSVQGAGTNGIDANFTFANDIFPDYANQSSFKFPNFNASFFGEHIFFLKDNLTFTPGFRLERISTQSEGNYLQVNFDNAGNPISNISLSDNRTLQRTFALFGLGVSYKPNPTIELYGNLSQNYRSVTFSDIRVASPTFIIDANIKDEKGYTADFGMRGNYRKSISFDVGGFALRYNNRIGIILDNRANRVRKNIGTAFIFGVESFVDWNLAQFLFPRAQKFKFNYFVNLAITSSKYIESEEKNVVGNKVEFIPLLNFKTGLKAGYKNLLFNLQLSHLSEQFTDAQNSGIPDDFDNRNGVIGEIPDYTVYDLSMSYGYSIYTIEAGILNILNHSYFTRRATGYPGPGIIPSDGRGFYLTLGLKF